MWVPSTIRPASVTPAGVAKIAHTRQCHQHSTRNHTSNMHSVLSQIDSQRKFSFDSVPERNKENCSEYPIRHNREYGILEIQDSKLRFRYNLNSLRTEEKEIWLQAIYVDDGQWHTAKVNTYIAN